MAVLRHSKGAHAGLMRDQAVAIIRAAESKPKLVEALEIFTGQKWSTLTATEKVDAVMEADTVGFASGAIAGAMRAQRDLDHEVWMANHDVTLKDENRNLERDLANEAAKTERLDAQLREVRAENTALKARPAMAVDSKGTQR